MAILLLLNNLNIFIFIVVKHIVEKPTHTDVIIIVFYADATYQLTITSLCIMNPEYKQLECEINLCPVDSVISFTLSTLNSYKEHFLQYFA